MGMWASRSTLPGRGRAEASVTGAKSISWCRGRARVGRKRRGGQGAVEKLGDKRGGRRHTGGGKLRPRWRWKRRAGAGSPGGRADLGVAADGGLRLGRAGGARSGTWWRTWRSGLGRAACLRPGRGRERRWAADGRMWGRRGCQRDCGPRGRGGGRRWFLRGGRGAAQIDRFCLSCPWGRGRRWSCCRRLKNWCMRGAGRAGRALLTRESGRRAWRRRRRRRPAIRPRRSRDRRGGACATPSAARRSGWTGPSA